MRHVLRRGRIQPAAAAIGSEHTSVNRGLHRRTAHPPRSSGNASGLAGLAALARRLGRPDVIARRIDTEGYMPGSLFAGT